MVGERSMTAAWLIIGAVAAIAFVYAFLSVIMGLEGRQIVDRCARVPRMTNVGGEERIYLRRSRRRRWGLARRAAYKRPLELSPNLPDDAILPPPREVHGRNGEA